MSDFGTVYVLYDDFNKISRIGKTIIGSKRIENQLAYYHSTLVPFEFRCSDYHNVETYIHRVFNNRRKKGDWFYLNPCDVLALMDEDSYLSGNIQEVILPKTSYFLKLLCQNGCDNKGISRYGFDNNKEKASARVTSQRKSNRNKPNITY